MIVLIAKWLEASVQALLYCTVSLLCYGRYTVTVVLLQVP